MNRSGSAGYSLVAVLLGIALTSIVLVSIGQLVDLGTRRSAGPEIEMQALAVAEALLEEIVSLPLRDPDDAQLCGTPEPARGLYDDVCDFRGFNRAAADGLLVGAAGPAAFAVQVEVITSALAGFHPQCESPGGRPRCARIEVLVTPPSGRAQTLSAHVVDADD